MKIRQIHGDPRTWAVILDKGDEAVDSLRRFAREKELSAAHFTAIGAFSSVTVGFFDRLRKDYRPVPILTQVEVLSLIGDITLEDGGPEIHAHVVVGRENATTAGGHLLQGFTWPTLEIMVTESAAHLRRRWDDETGLALIDPGA